MLLPKAVVKHFFLIRDEIELTKKLMMSGLKFRIRNLKTIVVQMCLPLKCMLALRKQNSVLRFSDKNLLLKSTNKNCL